MYRTIFNPKSARWVVQILTYGFIWRTVQAEILGGFETFEAAQAFVEKVGIPSVYRSYRDSTAAHVMSGAQPYYPPQVLRTNRA